MTADPVDPNVIYVLNFELLKSIDGGATFKPMKRRTAITTTSGLHRTIRAG